MEGGGLALLGGGGGSSGASTNESTLSKVEVVEAEACSYPVEAELELGLGLSLGGGGGGGKSTKASAWGECGRILTAKDFPSVVSQPQRGNNNNAAAATSAVAAVSGTKRTADSVSHEGGSPTSASQVVGWPPIRAYRMNSLVNQAKAQRAEEDKGISEKEKAKDVSKKKICNGNTTNANGSEKMHLGFVKVNMDGVPIGRKVDLNAHASYETLAQTLEDMFFRSSSTMSSTGEMFLSSVKRLRIMRTSEANGLAPRSQERNERQRSKPV
ncbi:hypothetical protein Tsubulata_024972 [Turnera subulata]|uniref:Auxin-responsive protein n=1 Tax=Turnera subulata TaxID=218843 RepID=A0A9Q0FYJ1_9ROSI|nr:hypothetical protein Tsubulata_024972 [Turnera subulata]